MAFRAEAAFYVLGFLFYILTLRGADRLETESEPVARDGDLSKPRWLALWRLHRRAFPRSHLRWRLPLRLALVILFVASGTAVAVMRAKRGF